MVRRYDASENPALLKNQKNVPWEKVAGVIMSYLNDTLRLFLKTDAYINPERRIGEIKVDDKILSTVP
jgi:hypothetical protein